MTSSQLFASTWHRTQRSEHSRTNRSWSKAVRSNFGKLRKNGSPHLFRLEILPLSRDFAQAPLQLPDSAEGLLCHGETLQPPRRQAHGFMTRCKGCSTTSRNGTRSDPGDPKGPRRSHGRLVPGCSPSSSQRSLTAISSIARAARVGLSRATRSAPHAWMTPRAGPGRSPGTHAMSLLPWTLPCSLQGWLCLRQKRMVPLQGLLQVITPLCKTLEWHRLPQG